MIIGVTGKQLSGKSTVAEYLRDRYGFRMLCFTEDLLKPILEKRKEPVNRISLIRLGMEIRKKYKRKDALVMLLSRKISTRKNYAIAGIRFPEEVSFMRKKFGRNFVLIAVKASVEIRFMRAKASMRFKEQVISMKDFLKIEKLPTEKIIPKTMRLADFTVQGGFTKEKLRGDVDGVMKELALDIK